jgi:predicted nucleic acid-binding protein
MIPAVLADTNPLYAAVDEADERHERASRDLRKLDSERRLIIIPFTTLLESHTLVLLRLGRAAARNWLELMSNATLMNPEQEDYRQAIVKLRHFPDQKITLYDALLAVLAARMGLQVWTYDHHFDVMRVPVWR